MVQQYGTRARFVVEDLGASPLAEGYGVDKYPAIFVDDALVARPEDFFAWGGPGNGKYIPWTDLENRRKFQSDLKKMLDIRLSGGAVADSQTPAVQGSANLTLPDFAMTDLNGATFRFSDLKGKPVLVEFWATWCPYCIDTLEWMKGMDSSSATMVAVAIESERPDIDKVIDKYKPNARIVLGTDELRKAFNGPPAVPTLFLADSQGRIVKIFYGAPKDLHDEIKRELAKLAGP